MEPRLSDLHRVHRIHPASVRGDHDDIVAHLEREVGNLHAVRDFSDVRDVVRGYALLWERGVPGEAYNLCSGVGTSVAAIVETLAAESGTAITCSARQERLRGREIPIIVGSPARAAALGWRPEIPLRQTLRDLLEDWRKRLLG